MGTRVTTHETINSWKCKCSPTHWEGLPRLVFLIRKFRVGVTFAGNPLPLCATQVLLRLCIPAMKNDWRHCIVRHLQETMW